MTDFGRLGEVRCARNECPFAEPGADAGAAATRLLLLCRVSDSGPIAGDWAAQRAGVRKPSGKEPAVDSAGGGIYGDLAAERAGRVLSGSAEPVVADGLGPSR